MRGLQWRCCLVYLDDIIVFAASLDKHAPRLEAVLQRLIGAGLKVKASKCQLVRSQVNFLGHRVDEQGIGTDPEKITAVRDWPTPYIGHGSTQFPGPLRVLPELRSGIRKDRKAIVRND